MSENVSVRPAPAPEVIELIASEGADLAAIRAKQDEILASKRKIPQLVVRHLLTEKETLTIDQQEQLFGMLRTTKPARCLAQTLGL